MTTEKRALVLGGATGLLGQALVETLRAADWEVVATGRNTLNTMGPHIAEDLTALVEEARPSCIFNTVAYTQVDAAEDNPHEAALLNASFPAVLGRIVKQHPCHLVHYSTDFVFNGKKRTAYTVEDQPDPLNVYGSSKLSGENALLRLELPRCSIIRTAWLFGPGKGNFVRTILNKCKEKPMLSVVDDQIGSPTYTLDLASYSLRIVEVGATGLFHGVNSGQASWCEFADEAVRLAQMECVINSVPSSAYPQKAVRPGWSVLDPESLTRATGIVPRPWPQALRDYIFRDFPPEG